MNRLCVIGDPVGHSLSPVIQQCMLRAAGLDWCYERCCVRRGELADFMAAARQGAYVGFNVTMPHKKTILPLLDELTAEARCCGAVNTVRMTAGRAIGHNTDAQGFVDSLRAADFAPEGKCVLLLGSGGAAQAVAAAVLRSGAAQVIVCARHREQAQRLKALYDDRVKLVPFTQETLFAYSGAVELLVNATPLGMAGQEDFSDVSFLRQSHALIYDLVYHPEETTLLHQAKQLHLATVGGMELLIHQAMLAFTFFTGIEPEAAMKQTIREALRQV